MRVAGRSKGALAGVGRVRSFRLLSAVQTPPAPFAPPPEQAELQDCQQALRLAKAESGRRLKELQLLQRQAAADEGAGTEAALQAEQQARQAAEAQLREARQGLARKAALVKELRAKVGWWFGGRGERAAGRRCILRGWRRGREGWKDRHAA